MTEFKGPSAVVSHIVMVLAYVTDEQDSHGC